MIIAAETAAQREQVRRYYVDNPPPPIPDDKPHVKIDGRTTAAAGKRGIGMKDADIAALRQYMMDHRGMPLAKMQRETGICTETLRKYGSDLIVR